MLLTLIGLALQIGCDQATKQLARDDLAGQGSVDMLGGSMRLVYVENPGAFLGMGGTMGGDVRFWIFTVIVGLGLFAGLAFLLFRREIALVPLVAGVTIVAGGIGNLIDRIFQDGRVTDFMQLGVGWLKTGIFNVADLQIVFGALVLVWVTYRTSEVEPPAAESTQPPEPVSDPSA